MIRGIGVTNPVLPRRDSGGRGRRDDAQERGTADAEETPADGKAQEPSSRDSSPPDTTHHIDEYV